MSKDIVNAPTARTWREIPQPVLPRAMSREGKWRFTTAMLRGLGVAAVVGGVLWGGWEVMRALQENPAKMPAEAKTVAVKTLELKTNGVLGNEWLARTLALPKNASLMELDLQALRHQLLAGGQVKAASLTKSFPETLKVAVSERSPVARMMVELHGEKKALLVAGDGVIFDGVGFAPELVDSLPWLDGVKLVTVGDRWEPIANIGPVADLLARAKQDAEHLYKTWGVVSLARLDEYAEIEVRTKPGTVVVFGVNSDFFQQLAKLDYQWDAFAEMATPPVRIDLSTGRDVAVSFQPVATPTVVTRTSSSALKFGATPASSSSSNSVLKIKL